MMKLEVKDLNLDYGAYRALKNVSLKLEQGKIVVLLGPSGSGKTTLLRAIAGFESPKSGEIRIGDTVAYNGGQKIDMPAEKRDLGFVFQSYALWPHRTVNQNVSYPLSLRSVGRAEANGRVTDVLEGLGLGHLGDRFPHQLSGGQQQRVAIARGLVYGPPVLLLDEPLSNLDAKLREEAKAWLRRLIVERGLSAVMVTHDQSEAMAIADHIILLSNGAIEQEGSAEQVYSDPGTQFCAEFFGNNNRLTGKVVSINGNAVDIAGEGWTLKGTAREQMQPGDEVTAIIRVEHVRHTTGTGPDHDRVEMSGSMYGGDRWQHIYAFGNTNIRGYGYTRMAPGPLALEIAPEKVWIWKRASQA